MRLVLLISASFAAPCMADVVTYQHLRSNDFVASYTGVRDTELLAGGFADYNTGGRTTMQWNAQREAILRFGDLHVMDGQYSGINSVKIVLTKASVSASGFATIVDMFQIADANASWGAGSGLITPASIGEATWNNRAHPSTPWAGSPGLSTPGVDYVTPRLDRIALFPDDPHNLAFYEMDVPTSLVSQWITGGVKADVNPLPCPVADTCETSTNAPVAAHLDGWCPKDRFWASSADAVAPQLAKKNHAFRTLVNRL